MLVISLRRAGVPGALRKGHTRGPKAGAKYLRRIPYMHNGKLEWRYIYKTAKERNAGRRAFSSTDENHHLTLKELAKLFPKLRAVVRTASHTGPAQIKELLDAAEAEATAKIQLSPAFRDAHYNPVLAKEKRGEDSERNPVTQTAQALSMLPDSLRHFVNSGLGDYTGITDFGLISQGDKEHIDVAKHHKLPPENVRGWAGGPGTRKNVEGKLRVAFGPTANSIYGAQGDPTAGGEVRYKHPKIVTECIVLHEYGHHVHFFLEELHKLTTGGSKAMHPSDLKKLKLPKGMALPPGDTLSNWQSLHDNKGSEKISGYAEENWKEDFAETFAAALTVPQELGRRCPERYEFMRKHLMPELPELSDLADIPSDELAWWRGDHSPVASVLFKSKQQYPQPRFESFYSDKDQFYTLQKDGRSLFIRWGPMNIDEEDGWASMPDVIDPETGLPVGDSKVALNFRSDKRLKEIFDEHGNSLNPNQAFLYLSQNDPEMIENVKEAQRAYPLADDPLQAYELWMKKKSAKHTLNEKMYIAFGQSGINTDAEKKKEREKVQERQAAGKVDKATGLVRARHQWAPVEMSENEFLLKSGTFKFGKVRVAEEQPWVRLKDGGVVINPADGKPERAATVYDQENPDGTIFQVTVAESEPFSAGDVIVAPRPVVDPTSGTTSYVWPDPPEAWFEIPDGIEDAHQLARKFRVDVAELLKRNQKFQRGQILDPIMAALINPSGERIRDHADLDYLMRVAAREQPETWVTVHGGKTANAPLVQVRVKFDGAGPPLVMGEYWARKLGKAEGEPVRLDELLTPDDELKISAKTIKETEPQKLKVRKGNPVWVTVRSKTTGQMKRVMATLVKRTKVKGEDGEEQRAYVVSVLPGQAGGLPKGPTTVSSIESVGEEEIPGKPGRRRRFIEPMPSDVLLYMDNVRVGSDEFDTEGTIKILPPKDGSWTIEDLAALPGVRVTQVDEDAIPSLVISARDLSKLRDHLGAVLMDTRVQASFELQAEQERARKASLQQEPWPPTEAFEDINGNVAPNGVLRGLNTGDDGMQPGEHRIEAMQKMALNDGRLYAAHFMGTGKTALGIASAQMMRNLTSKDDPSKPHPKQVKKKVLCVVPLNTANNWEDEVEFFSGKQSSLIGSGTLAGAAQMYVPKPPRGPKESDEEYKSRTMAAWKDAVDPTSRNYKPALYNPWADDADNVVIPYEYFRNHEEMLRFTGLFDGMIVDEAHNIARENQLSSAVERWNSEMNMMLLLSGTPITNKLDTIPRIVELVTAGKVTLGTEEEFTENYLVESSVMKASGKTKVPKTDINPQKVGELAGILQPLMHVALSQDVKGKVMPAVLLDENNPAHMRRNTQQARMYRYNMKQMTPSELEAMTESAAVGTDEMSNLSENGRRKVAVARSIANCPTYKAPDANEFLRYKTKEPKTNKKTGKAVKNKLGEIIEVEVTRPFQMPDWETLTRKKAPGWGGKWPKMDSARVDQGYMTALAFVFEHMFGMTYESVAGKAIDPKILKGVKGEGGAWITPTGLEYGKVRNPDYGPEGMICRGTLKDDGTVDPITGQWFNPDSGKYEDFTIPVGHRMIRDPNAKQNGLFYDQEDWIFSGGFSDSGEGKESGDETADEVGAKKKKKREPKGTKQQAKDPALSVQRSTKRRKQRAMFDAMVSHENAKTDKLEELIHTSLTKEHLGPDQQFIIFGNRIGSSVRTVEAKLRTMGYQDVNEALGHPEISGEGDKNRPGTRKFFVSYMGKGATLGDRDLNSEIFRQKRDKSGANTGQSVFVHRALYGSSGSPPKVGQFKQGWSRGQRKRIEQGFQDHRKKDRDGNPAGMEMPMRVTAVQGKGKGPNGEPTIEYRYVYESDMKAKDKTLVKKLEQLKRGSPRSEKRKIDKQLNAIFARYQTDRLPLSEHQQYVYNNCQFMVASDAANVGLNWPAPQLIMYDSLFSPMDEWQRITRAARMLPAVIGNPNVEETQSEIRKVLASDASDADKEKKLKGLEGEYKKRMLSHLTRKLDAMIAETEKANGLKEWNFGTALEIVQEHIDRLDPDEREALGDLEGGGPDQIMEAIFASRALEKIDKLRHPVRDELRRHGHIPDPSRARETIKNPPEARFNYVPPAAIQNSDVMNEIINRHLTPFEHKLLQSRKYLVHVTRLTTSVEVPEMITKKVDDPERPGKKKKISIPTGKWNVESPTHAERSQLTQGRAKMVPFERFLKLVQDAQPTFTDFDTMAANPDSLGKWGVMPDKLAAKKEKALAARKRKIMVPVFKITAEGKHVATGEQIETTAEERKAEMKEMRRQEREDRKRIRDERRAADKVRKKAIREQRAAESRARAKAKKKKPKKRGTKTKKSFFVMSRETFHA